ncbi:MAG TPA: transcriptional regulator [Opitutaceae bacterium]|nr:transcriptional regulator [Opitutaceae bacterium]
MQTHDPLRKTLHSLAPTCAAKDAGRFHALVQFIQSGDEVMKSLRGLLASEGLTAEGFQALAALNPDAEATALADLVDRVDSPRALLSQTLSRLELSGLISRQRGTEDRRAIWVRVTPEGRKAVQRAWALLYRGVLDLVDDFDDLTLREFNTRCTSMSRRAQKLRSLSAVT